MKKIKLSIITGIFVLGVLIPINQGCKKYPEGSMLSLSTRKARVANTWKVDNYKINGTDLTSLVSGYSETFTKSGEYSYEWGILNGKGSWDFENKDTEINLNGNDGQSSRQLFILKLEQKEFWYYYMEGNDKHELHLTGE